MPSLGLSDLDLPLDAPEAAPAASAPEAMASATEPSPLEFDTDDLALTTLMAATPEDSEAKDSAPAPLEFDLGDLSLDLSLPATAPAAADAAETPPEDPLATKLALAEEFSTIGDSEGARTLVEEVIAESSGELKLRAQRLLAELG